MVEPKLVAERAEKDKVLKAKVERMEELLAAFCPEVNRKFWDSVRKLDRSTSKR
jgi:hypothetical protein